MPEPFLQGYSIWLRPEARAAGSLERLIGDMAARFQTIPFPPHLTLLGQIPLSGKEVTGRLDKLELAGPVEVGKSRPEHSNAFYRCITLNIPSNDRLVSLRTMIQNQFPEKAQEEFEPHLSLVYGCLPEAQRKKILAQLHGLPLTPLRFTHVVVVRTHGRIQEWRIQRKWELC